MADEYGFSIKTKSNAGPKIKYCSASFDNEGDAMAFATVLNAHLANNAKAACAKKIVKVTESAYEIPSDQMNLKNEVWAMFLLRSLAPDGSVNAQSVLTIPCVDGSMLASLLTSLSTANIVLSSGDVSHTVNSVSILKTSYYAV